MHAVDYLQIVRNRWREIFLTFLLVFMAAAVVTYLLPKKYTAVVQFSISNPKATIDPLKLGETILDRNRSSFENFLPTQFEIIAASETLKYVVDEMGLDEEWKVSQEEAIARLKGMLKIVPIRNTANVNVWVSGLDPRQVQAIAEAVINAYRLRREKEENELALKTIHKLKETLQIENSTMIQKMHQLKKLIEKGNYVGASIWNNSPDASFFITVHNEEEEHKQASDNLRDTEKLLESLQTHIAQIDRLPDDQLLNYIISADMIDAEVLGMGTLREKYNDYQARLREKEALLVSGYGPKHQRVSAADKGIGNVKEELDAGVANIRASLITKMQFIASKKGDAQKRFDEAKVKLQKKTIYDNELMQAKREYSMALENVRRLENSHIAEVAALRIPRSPITVQEHAVVPTSPSSPNVSLYLGVGAGMGLLFGLVAAFLLEYFDTSVKNVEEVEKALGVPVIGVIPKNIGVLYQQAGGDAPDVEAYRILRTNIELTKKTLNEISLAFVSGTAGEGKTTTLCNLAYVYAQAGYTTLMIDADMRRSKLNQYFDLDNTYGLSNYLTSDDTLEDVVLETEMDNLFILPAGPAPRDPSGLLSSRKMADLLREAKRRFDVILIDSPPILGVSDSAVIVRAVDATVMVVQPRKLSEKVLRKEKEVIENSGGNLIGVALNNVDIGSDQQYQYYTTYYMYTPGDKEGQSGVKKRKAVRKETSKGSAEIASTDNAGRRSTGERVSSPVRDEEEDLY